jgi:hypothetical protein
VLTRLLISATVLLAFSGGFAAGLLYDRIAYEPLSRTDLERARGIFVPRPEAGLDAPAGVVAYQVADSSWRYRFETPQTE